MTIRREEMVMSTSIADARSARTMAVGLTPFGARLMVVAAMAAAAAAGFVLSGHSGAADPALTRLLRAMAVIKAFIAAGAGVALYWRLAVPIGPWRLAAYAAAGAAMAAGPGVIWNMSHIAAGAALLHGGLAATIFLLWRDPGMAARLEQAIAQRNRKNI
jgi:hypothetical protein